MINDNYTLLNRETVQKNLINLKQITFEVTDACNLKCKYCGYGEFYSHYDNRDSKMLPTIMPMQTGMLVILNQVAEKVGVPAKETKNGVPVGKKIISRDANLWISLCLIN